MDQTSQANQTDFEQKKLDEIVKEYENSEIKNLCIECGVDMGYCNPRQYCGKTYCLNQTESN
jgi:hypothetical protein